MRRRVGVVLGVFLLAAGAGGAAGQYIEPLPRAPGVVAPLDRLLAMDSEASRLGLPKPGVLPTPARVERRGTRGMVVIPALFADSPEPFVSPQAVQAALFDGPSPRGTVSDFFSDQSGGVFTIDGEVVPWVRTSITLVEAAGTDGTFGERLGDYIREAIAMADPSVDFGRFDNDGPDGVPNSGDDNGVVDGITIQFQEVAGSCGGPGIWPHLSGVFDENGQPYRTQDLRPDGSPISVQVYIADSVVDCSGTQPQGPEVMAHEIGHLLGLPDYYRQAEGLQPWQRHWVVGCFDLMAAGSWGCGGGPRATNFGPTGFSARSRAVLGWATLEEVGRVTDQEYTLEPLQEGRRALEIPMTEDGTESLIVEYRPRTGYDGALPAGGVLVYHYDRAAAAGDGRWIPPGLPPVYGYQLVEADGDGALLKVDAEGGNRGVASDVFARDGAIDSLVDGPPPSTRDHLDRPTRVRLRDIRVVDGAARLRVTTSEGFAVASRTAPGRIEGGRPFSMASRVDGGTLPLQVTELSPEDDPPGLSLVVNAAEVSLSGVLLEPDTFHVSVRIRDAASRELIEHMTAPVGDPTITAGALAAAAAGSGGEVSPNEGTWLDNAGNRNGRLDVGDVRASLVRRGVFYEPGG